MSTEKDIAERLRAAFVQHHGNKVGDPFVSQIAREIAAAASAIEARRAETGTGSVHESAAREAGTPIPSVVGEVVEAARAYLISTRASADTRPKRELKAALSALDAAPRIRVEEVAREIMVADDCGLTVKGERVLCDHPLALGRNENCGCRAAARAVLSLLASGVPAGERARIRNEVLEEAAVALIAASEGEPERWVDVSDDTGQRIGARLEGRTQKLLRGMQAATIVRALKTKD